MSVPPPSNKKIDRAGLRLRGWWRSDDVIPLASDPDLLEALHLISGFRTTFQRPQRLVTVGLRNFVARESGTMLVSQRLKRLGRIVEKLHRFQNMKLTRMQDIGGCRAILDTESEVRGVLARIERHWDVRHVADYMASPKDTGYRAVHVVAVKEERLIEVQLRTRRQHAWAADVEREASRRTALHFLKDGRAPRSALEYYRVIGVLLELQERDLPADAGLYERYEKLHREVFGSPPDG